MPYCIHCDNDLCVCPRGETREITIMIDEDTRKAIKEEALSPDFRFRYGTVRPG